MVMQSWQEPFVSQSALRTVMEKLERLKPILKEWIMEVFGNFNVA